MRGAPPLWRGGALVLGLAFAWGVNWPVTKMALGEIPLWTFRAWTCGAGALLLFALARLNGGAVWPARREWGPIAIAAVFNVTAWHVLAGYGVMMMGSGRAAVLAFTMPVWTALLGVALGERLTGSVVAALALGLGAIFVLLTRDLSAVGDSPLGVAFMLIAAIGWAVGTVYQKRQRWTVQLLALAAWQLALGSLPIWAVLAFVEGFAVPDASLAAWIAMIYLVLVSLGFAYYAWFRMVSLYPALIAAIGTLLCPVLGVASGALFLGEPFGWREVAALALVGTALALVLVMPALRGRSITATAD